MKFHQSLSVLASVFGASAVVLAQQQQMPSVWQLINEVSGKTGELSQFQALTSRSQDLVNVLAGNSSQYGGETVNQVACFAPINQAFSMLPSEVTDLLLNPTAELQLGGGRTIRLPEVGQRQLAAELLQGLLAYHVVRGNVSFAQPIQNTTFPTINGWIVTIGQSQVQKNQTGMQQFKDTINATAINVTGQAINDAQILGGFEASNGALYIVDRVISPLYFVNTSISELPNRVRIPRVMLP